MQSQVTYRLVERGAIEGLRSEHGATFERECADLVASQRAHVACGFDGAALFLLQAPKVPLGQRQLRLCHP